jgi:uncharacterized protein YjbJ (UPF0337 family)
MAMEEQQHQLNGGVNHGVGRMKEAAGALFGDLKVEAQGRAQQLRGQAESLYGDTMERLSHVTHERPAVALGTALGIGVIIGILLAR